MTEEERNFYVYFGITRPMLVKAASRENRLNAQAIASGRPVQRITPQERAAMLTSIGENYTKLLKTWSAYNESIAGALAGDAKASRELEQQYEIASINVNKSLIAGFITGKMGIAQAKAGQIANAMGDLQSLAITAQQPPVLGAVGSQWWSDWVRNNQHNAASWRSGIKSPGGLSVTQTNALLAALEPTDAGLSGLPDAEKEAVTLMIEKYLDIPTNPASDTSPLLDWFSAGVVSGAPSWTRGSTRNDLVSGMRSTGQKALSARALRKRQGEQAEQAAEVNWKRLAQQSGLTQVQLQDLIGLKDNTFDPQIQALASGDYVKAHEAITKADPTLAAAFKDNKSMFTAAATIATGGQDALDEHDDFYTSTPLFRELFESEGRDAKKAWKKAESISRDYLKSEKKSGPTNISEMTRKHPSFYRENRSAGLSEENSGAYADMTRRALRKALKGPEWIQEQKLKWGKPVEAVEDVEAAPPVDAPQAAVKNYTVKAGDTTAKLATRWKTTVQAIAEANKLPDPKLIKVNQVLTIPAPKVDDSSARAAQESTAPQDGVHTEKLNDTDSTPPHQRTTGP